MTVPKVIVDYATIFPVVARIHDSILNLMDPKNQLLEEYLASIDSTPIGFLLPKVSQKGVDGLSKGSKGIKMKKQTPKLKYVDEELVK